MTEFMKQEGPLPYVFLLGVTALVIAFFYAIGDAGPVVFGVTMCGGMIWAFIEAIRFGVNGR